MKGVLATELNRGLILTDFRGREEALHGVAEQPTACAYNEAAPNSRVAKVQRGTGYVTFIA